MGWVFFLAVLATLALAYASYLQEKKRTAVLAELAADLGMRFAPGLDRDHDDRYAQFEIFRRGHSRVARNTMLGQIELFGRPCLMLGGDFRYKVTSGAGKHRSTRTYRFSYLIVHPPWQTPPLLVRREGFFDKLKGALGFDDIDFESDEFSRAFYVQSTDKRFAYDVLHPRMMEFLLHEQPPMIDIEDGAMCVSDGRGRWEPDRFRAEIAFVQRFCEQWPRHLVKDLEN
ncbi:MAG TPA: hypothetical protein ENI87_07100 [bacterium]|nr:hypothetical protein [bacterium]